MKITVDKNKCIGCNICFELSEGTIGTKFGTDRKAGVNPESDLNKKEIIEAVKIAAEACPMQAIEIEE